ncbi:MAG: hypothetical protein BKP49_06480 [Treponema sp. CETP13]|nr:MAG: hypothetical protein BKP49_06480 [Treponema sp. CETP13]
MSLLSLGFILFLLQFLIAFYIRKTNQWVILLVASTLFYASYDVRAFIFIVFSITTTYFAGRKIEAQNMKIKQISDKVEKRSAKKAVKHSNNVITVWVIVLNFTILFGLKYISYLLHYTSHLQTFSIFNRFFMPLGISFYTFQAMGYLMDVNNKQAKAEKNYFKFALFISFFPQIIQGPISTFNDLQPELTKTHTFNYDNLIKGMWRIMYGLLKKFIIADSLLPIVTEVFDHSGLGNGFVNAMGILAYAFYQYCDFSGGIDLIIGTARLFDIKMIENFKRPYFSTSLTNFWHRWHISLGNWMRKYVFYPFALTSIMMKFGKWTSKKMGKFAGRVMPAAIANILVFALIGIWHGFELHFILWGLYNGFVIAIASFLEPAFGFLRRKTNYTLEKKPWHIFAIVRTFIVVNIGWIFDRANTWSDICKIFVNSIHGHFQVTMAFIPPMDIMEKLVFLVALLFLGLVFIISLLQENKKPLFTIVKKCPMPLRYLLFIGLFIGIIIVTIINGSTGVFMYARF